MPRGSTAKGGEAGVEPGGAGGKSGSSHNNSYAGTVGIAGNGATERLQSSNVFAEAQVLDVRIEIDPADWQTLEEHGNDEVYFPAAVGIEGNEFPSLSLARVGFRHKGSWTLNHCWDDFDGVRSYDDECAKLSYKIDFAEYDSEARFEGLKRLNLHAASGDDSKLRELLGYSTFNDFGIPAPRTVPARLTINGELQGLFIAVEQIDGRFTKTHFPEGGDGNLYKEMWPRTANSVKAMTEALVTNELVSDISDMQGFASAASSATEANFADTMAPWVDLQQMLRYIAVDRALKNWDGIMAFYSPARPHNFYFYHDNGPEGRFHLIPWDLDNVFWAFDPVMAPAQWVTAEPVPDWNVAPAACDPMPIWEPDSTTRVTPPGCDPLLGLLAKTQWQRFTELAAELVAGPIRYEVMDAKVRAWELLLEPLVQEDPLLDVGVWHTEVARFRQILRAVASDLEAFVARGYTVEQPAAGLPEPPAEEFTKSSTAGGLHLAGVNNFEFSDGVTGAALADSYSYADAAAVRNSYWNTASPIDGTADFRFDFEYVDIPGDPWNEYSAVVLSTQASRELDISAYTQISITLRADSERNVRIRANSPAYDDVFGGVWTEFGIEVSVSTTARTFKLRLDRFFYADWARDAWKDGQGWTSSDDVARQTVLQRFNGLIFAPSPHTDSAGELEAERDPGFLEIDDIYFQ